MADSWKTDGNCSECRRHSYCSKQCSAHKNAMINAVRAVLSQKFGFGLIKEKLAQEGKNGTEYL